MSRSDEGSVYKQAKGYADQDQNNAQTAFGGAESGIGDFKNRLDQYYSADPYKSGGDFEKSSKIIESGAANANSNALQNELNLAGKRSGENTASYAPTLLSAQRQGVLDVADREARDKQSQLENETRYQQYGLNASEFPVNAQTQLYHGAVGGRDAALSEEQKSAQAPGFWDWFMQNAQQGAKTGAEIAAA